MFLALWSGAGVRIRRYYGHRQTIDNIIRYARYDGTDEILLGRMLFKFGLRWALWTDLIKTAFKLIYTR